MTDILSRRRVITNGGLALVGVGGLALAGCAPNTGSGSPGGSATGGLAPGTELVSLSDLPVGSLHAVRVDGTGVLLSRPSEDVVLAFSEVCTHQGCAVAVAGGDFACPCHDSRFGPDGAVLGGPAPRPLDEIAVSIEGERVVIA